MMISVIIPHLNQPAALRRGLSALAEQAETTAAVEIIVVDNGSAELPTDICAEFSNVRLLQQPEPGPGPARNLGVAHSCGDILAFIDADCVAAPHWLKAIEYRFTVSPDATILGGDVHILRQDKQSPTLLECYESVFAFRMKEYIAKKGFTGAGNLAVRRDTFDAVGPFGGITIAEDTEWGQRASRMGYRVRYEPSMIVYHPARQSFAELTRKWDRHVAHDFGEIKARRLWWARWVVRSMAVAASPAAEIGRIALSDRLEGSRARLLAFAGVVRIRAYRARKMLALALGGDANKLTSSWNRAAPKPRVPVAEQATSRSKAPAVDLAGRSSRG